MRKLLYVIILIIIPLEGQSCNFNEKQMPDSLVVFCYTPLCIIDEFKIVVKEDSLSISHHDWSGQDTLLLDYVCHNKDTIIKMIQYYNEFKVVKTTYINPDSVIHYENAHSIVICAYSDGNEKCRETTHDEFQLYPLSYIRFLALIYSLLNDCIDIDLSFPFNTGPDPSFLR